MLSVQGGALGGLAPASSQHQPHAPQAACSEPMDTDANPHPQTHPQAPALPGAPAGAPGLQQPLSSEAAISSGQQAGPAVIAPQVSLCMMHWWSGCSHSPSGLVHRTASEVRVYSHIGQSVRLEPTEYTQPRLAAGRLI